MNARSAFNVRIEPSGHTFTALPDETLLEAALRSGLNVNYSCSSGSCGDCRVRLLSGEVQSRPADFTFTAKEKGEGYILLCSNHAASDLVIAAQEAHGAADIPVQHIPAKITKTEERGGHLRILNVRTPRTKTLRFLAGQYVCLHLPEGSIDAAVASCPCNGMQLQFHLKKQDGLPFVEHIFQDDVQGQAIEIEGPFGEVTLDDDSQRPLLMVAVNEEFAPIKSLIEHAINLDLGQPVRLFWLTAADIGHYLENYCRAWSEVLDDYRYTPVNMSENRPGDHELTELVDMITEQVAELDQADIYLAGPVDFQQKLCSILREHGADVHRMFLPSRLSLQGLPQQYAGGDRQ